jgi:hypothetical protein
LCEAAVGEKDKSFFFRPVCLTAFTSQNVSFVHEVSGEQDDSPLFARLKQRPQVAARVGVHPSSWLVQEDDLPQNGQLLLQRHVRPNRFDCLF